MVRSGLIMPRLPQWRAGASLWFAHVLFLYYFFSFHIRPIPSFHSSQSPSCGYSSVNMVLLATLIRHPGGALKAKYSDRWGELDHPEPRTVVAPPPSTPFNFPPSAFIEADLAAPQLSLQVAEDRAQNASSARFYLNFLGGGICSLWNEEDSPRKTGHTFG